MTAKRLLAEWAAVFLLMAFAFARRKKIRLLPSFLLTASVTFFALLSPMGKVLTTVSSLKITQGALFAGLHKSAILTGMVFLSQTIVSYNIRLPGKAGAFLRRVFFYFNQLTAQRVSLKKGHIIEQIDSLLLSVWQETPPIADAPLLSKKSENS